MEFTQLGRTGLKVSRFCLGTMNFGPQTSEEDSFAIMDKAHDLGINFFDTANVYGWKIGEGVTENIVGRWFAQGGGRRGKTVIAAKVFGRMGGWPNQSRLSALHIREACEDYGLGLIPWSPLSGGLLGGALQKIKEGRRASKDAQKEIKKKRAKLEAWERFCKAKGEHPADMALAWLLKNPVVTAPIIGPRTMDQLTGALRAFKIKFSKDELQKIDEIWPGPGGEAPEAYAW